MASVGRVIVVGFGSAGRRHARNLLALGVREVAVVSEHRRLTEATVGDRQLPVFHGLDAALATRPEAAVIANPTAMHAEYVTRAIAAGCHVYIEKPLAATAGEGRLIADRARHVGRIAAVGCQLRFNPCLARLKDMMETGAVGRVLHVDVNMGEYLPDYHPDEDYRIGYAARRALGGGVLLTQIHDLNYVRWLFGPVQAAYAIGVKLSRLEIDVEDSVTMLLRSAAGLGVTLHMDYIQRPRRRTVVVIGEDATVRWDYWANSLLLTARDGSETELGPATPLDRDAMFAAAMADFLGCIETGATPRTDVADAVEDLRLVDAIRDALARGVVVPLADASGSVGH
jgi:predicted dehydrogenase